MEKNKLTVLIVEDQWINRQILSGLLQFDYHVLEAENGLAALAQLNAHPEIAAILLDVVMPVMDGYTFLQRLKDTDNSALPVIAMTGEKDDCTEQKVLDLGAWDFVSKPYQPATLLTRLKNVIIRSRYYLLSQMQYANEHDSLTGLLNRNAFFAEVSRLLEAYPNERFAMVRVDIDHFQTYNSFWGEEVGDKLLCTMANRLREIAKRCRPCVYGRINADVFCICAPDREDVIQEEAKRAFYELGEYNKEYRLVPSLGVYEVNNPKEKPQKMYELATLAAQKCKGSYLNYLSYYKPEMSDRILENQWIVNEMQQALEEEQFQVYLQPKYDLSTGVPRGAEALIRWNHPKKGMLSPGLFIPVFEQNGFIGKIDHYMWEHVCLLLRKWIDDGLKPAPISVNVSRVNLYNANLVDLLTELVNQYKIPPALLQLEMTESAYMANPQVMEQMVKELQARGFVILMDDFGSGYSSLNTLKDIHVNVLKIDMKFLADETDKERSRSIIASTVLLAGWLNMPVIMEGVETAEQVTFLKSIGCNYAQGYYFARPMPVEDYEKRILAGPAIPADKYPENLADITRALWSGDSHSELIFNSLEEPAAVYEYTPGRLRVLRANARFCSYLGPEFSTDKFSAHAERLGVDEESAKLLLETFQKAADSKTTATCRYWIQPENKQAQRICLMLHYWGMNASASIIFAQFFPEKMINGL